MYFASKIMLWLLVPIAVGLALAFAAAWRLRRKRLEAFMDPGLVSKHVDPVTFRLRRLKDILLFVSILLICLSLARPQWGQKTEQVKHMGLDIIVAIDISSSMLAEDLKPNRLEKARHELSTLIASLNGDRIGIVTFSGTSFLQCPLTLDYDAARMFLDIIDAGSIPVPGTAVASAIRRSVKAFGQEERGGKVVILITDGEDHEGGPVEAAKEARKNGVVIYTIGIGSAAGEPIPLRDAEGNLAGYKKDKNGRVVMSRLDETQLQKISQITGGKYYHATSDEMELGWILGDVLKMDKRLLSTNRFSRYQDQFEWFLVPAAILFLLEMALPERRFSIRRRHETA